MEDCFIDMYYRFMHAISIEMDYYARLILIYVYT